MWLNCNRVIDMTTWRSRSPVDSMREATFTVSPNLRKKGSTIMESSKRRGNLQLLRHKWNHIHSKSNGIFPQWKEEPIYDPQKLYSYVKRYIQTVSRHFMSNNSRHAWPCDNIVDNCKPWGQLFQFTGRGLHFLTKFDQYPCAPAFTEIFPILSINTRSFCMTTINLVTSWLLLPKKNEILLFALTPSKPVISWPM